MVIDPAELDGEDVEEMLDVARRWGAEGNAGQSRRLLLRLLRVPAALTDTTLHEKLVVALEAVEGVGAVMMLRPEPTNSRKVEARRRWLAVRPAA